MHTAMGTAAPEENLKERDATHWQVMQGEDEHGGGVSGVAQNEFGLVV